MTGAARPRPEIGMLLADPSVAARESSFGPGRPSPSRRAEIVAGLRTLPAPGGDRYPVAEVRELVAGPHGTSLRSYRPAVPGELPVLVYFHGGGWVFGDLDTHDRPCRALANAARCLVLSVDYRLAPEHPYPAPLEDAYATTEWVVGHAATVGGDPTRVAVAGASAGANLAAAVALRAVRASGPPVLAQALFCPALDATTSMPSFEENASGFNLSATEMRFYWDCYLQGHGDLHDPGHSPLHSEDLSGLPPTIIHTAGLDVLRDEGEAYAARLAAAGVPTVLRRYDGQIHGFASMGAITPDAGHSLAEVGAWLEAVFTT